MNSASSDPRPSGIFVIVPVFNVSQYLERCVSSILAQTRDDFEVLLIDDGSTDDSGRLCDEWARRDARVRTIHRKNGGLGAARNTGIETVLAGHSDGWITFLDSDDWLDPSFLESMLWGLRTSHAQIAVCRYWRPSTYSEQAPEGARAAGAAKSLSPQGFFSWCGKRETEGLFLGNMSCAKVYDLRLWQKIRFPEDGKAHEDMFTVYKVLFSSSGIAVVDAPLYAYFVNPSSITGGGYRWAPSRLNAVRAGREQVRYLEKRKLDEALATCLSWHFGRILWNLENMGNGGQTSLFRERLTEMLRDDWRRYHERLSPDVLPSYWSLRRHVHPVRASLVDPFRRFLRSIRRKGFGHAAKRAAQKAAELFSAR